MDSGVGGDVREGLMSGKNVTQIQQEFLFLFVSFGPTVLAQLHEHPFP